MRNFFFNLIGDFGEDLITLVQFVFNSLISLIAFVGDTLTSFVANIFKMSLWMIDRNRVDHTEMVIDQVPINNELQILINVTRVKEDALEQKTWTKDHSLAINHLSSKLYNECNWNEKRIHEYMKAIVESIPGLSYVSGDEDGDEDDDGSFALDD